MTSRIASGRVSYVRDIGRTTVPGSLDVANERVSAPVNRPSVMSAQERRFWERVNKNGPTNTRRPELGPCHVWTGSRYTSPKTGELTYGQTSYGGKRMSAHRAAFLMSGDEIPVGHDVMHRCDTKPCVRRDHLTTGTRSENLLDGFAAPANQGVCAGENNGRARLTWDIVHAIRSGNERTIDLARRYGVSETQITHIKHGRRWPESKCPMHSVDVAA